MVVIKKKVKEKEKLEKKERMKSQFKSKSSQGGCDLPNEKQFKRARKKLLDKWRNSQKIEGITKTTDTLTGIDTQISHSSDGSSSSDCSQKCQVKTWWGGEECGCCTGEVYNGKCNNGKCTDCVN